MIVGITTSPRQERYLLDTILSAKASCKTPLQFVVSPNFIDPDEDWAEIEKHAEVLKPLVMTTLEKHNQSFNLPAEGNRYAGEFTHRGIQHNSNRLMQYLINLTVASLSWPNTNPSFVVIQDDAMFCPEAFDRIIDVARFLETTTNRQYSMCGAVSFYSPYERFAKFKMPLVPYAGPQFYGEICLLWRRQAAIAYLATTNPNVAHDLDIGRFFDKSKWRLRAHYPCLAQHVGASSARGDAGQGVTQTMNYWAHHEAVTKGMKLQ